MSDFKDCTGECAGFGLTLTAPPPADPLEDVRARAEAGDGAAARHLGNCYREGDEAPFRPRQAFRWYVRGAFAGDAHAMNNLGACYHNGFACARNMTQAIHWYTQGATRGSEYAQDNLGRCYLNGNGVSRDRRRAIYLLRSAAKQGHERAAARLAKMGVEIYTAGDDYPIKVDDSD